MTFVRCVGGVDLGRVDVGRSFDHPVIIKELLGALSARFPERLPAVRVFKKRDDGTGHVVGVPNRCQDTRFSSTTLSGMPPARVATTA